MEMENTRRPSLDRSRELKKPRMGATEAQPNPNGRPFPFRPPPPAAAGAPPASGRFRAGNDRASEGSNDSSRTEAYQPQPQSYHELVNQYKTALSELTFNSKPMITNLTIIAGENLPAAKAIVATVCTNILEVPSEQKLPSLYLLDSIVKNIGRDYIRYFAARLPEVFCKAYRQVDPSVHPSMRHLFGTWKGVFPLQTLQMIERELGFGSAMNGSGAASSHPDSQSQRPQLSIHVNPKYLERQRLQQSSGRAKGLIDDEPLAGTNPVEDTERLDRASVIDTGRTWVDSSAKFNNIQHPHREVLSEPLHDKKNSAVYGDFGYGSSGSRNPSLEIVRMGRTVADPGNGRPWYGAASGITETVLGQRNGLTTKHGLLNYPTPRPSDVDVQLQPVSSIASRSISKMSANWKNSEEEEFMWDMHSRLSEEDAAKVSSTRDRWTPDDSEKVDFDDNLPKGRSLLDDTGSRFDGDASSDSLFTEQKETTFGMSSPYRLQELQSSDKLVDSVTSTVGIGHAGGYSSSLRGLAVSAGSSLTRMGPRLSSASALSGSIGTMVPQRVLHASISSSPTVQSFISQNSLSPLFPARHPQQQLQHTTEQNFPPSRSFPPLDNRLHKISGKIVPANIQLGKVQKTEPEDLLASSPSGPAFQLSQKYPLSKAPQSISKESDHVGPPPIGHQNSVSASIATSKSDNSTPEQSNPRAAKISGQSSTSSLLAAVMESGILTKLKTDGLPNQSVHDVGQAPVSSSIEPPLLKGPPSSLVTSSRSEVKSACFSAPLVHDDTSVISDTSQSKDEPPLVPPGPPTSAQAADVTASPISSLLSSLVAKGLISASKEETLNLLPPQKPAQPENQKPRISSANATPISSAPISSVHSGVVNKASALGSDAKTSDALPQNSSVMAESLIGLEFRPDILRELHPPVIDAVLNDLLQQCNICGIRLKIKERLDRHLEWHALKKAEPDGETKVTRRWYANPEDWVSGKAGVPLCIHLSECLEDHGMDADEPMVLADDNQCVCVLCGELFEDYYSQEKNTWLFRGAVHMTVSEGDAIVGSTYESGKGPIVHASCVSESPDNDFGIQAVVKPEKDA